MNIAIIGTGLMGSALAEGLIQAGHTVIAHNRTASKASPLAEMGARVAATPAEAITQADATILVLPDAQSVREVLLNDASRAVLVGRRILNASTTKPSEIVEISEIVDRSGGQLSEVSIMVGAEALRSRQGQFIVGCLSSEMEFWAPVLRSVGTRVDRAGSVGDASKAETPILFASMFGVVTAAYAAAAAIKHGLPTEVSAHYIQMAVPGSEYFLSNLFARNYDRCTASVDSFAGVSAAAIAAARQIGLPTAVLDDIAALFSTAQALGYGSKDGTAIGEVLLGA